MEPVRSIPMIVALCYCALSVRAEVVIETVVVGNPGNPDHVAYIPEDPSETQYFTYGAVDYVYRMGKFEITAGQYAEFLNAVAASDPYELYNFEMNYDPPGVDFPNVGCRIARLGAPGSYTYEVSGSTWIDRPANFISWGDAARFCNWLHNGQPTGPQGPGTTEDGAYDINGAMSNVSLMLVTRQLGARWAIPTLDEWHKAAFHKNDGPTNHWFNYPTSSDNPPSNKLIDPDPGNNATFRFADDWSTTISDYLGYGERTWVGAHENSQSPYGTYDQGGNVWEWTESPYSVDQGFHQIRGGGYAWFAGNLSANQDTRSPGPLFGGSKTMGFRVAQPPPPGDIDRDGDVDSADFTMLLDCLARILRQFELNCA